MNKRALILTVMALVLAIMLSGVPGLAQTVQQPKATPPQAEKSAVPASHTIWRSKDTFL